MLKNHSCHSCPCFPDAAPEAQSGGGPGSCSTAGAELDLTRGQSPRSSPALPAGDTEGRVPCPTWGAGGLRGEALAQLKGPKDTSQKGSLAGMENKPAPFLLCPLPSFPTLLTEGVQLPELSSLADLAGVSLLETATPFSKTSSLERTNEPWKQIADLWLLCSP